MKNRFLLLFMLAFASACDNSIQSEAEEDPSAEDDGGTEPGDDEEDAGAPEPGEPSEETIDASSETEWVFLDLETAKIVEESETSWDLGLRRYTIKVNGGASGDGGVTVAMLKKKFAEVKADSATTFVTDAEDSADADADPDYVFSTGDTAWFKYDGTTHKLTPQPYVYVVKTVEGGIFKVEITDYYNDAGSSGYPKLRFERLQAAEQESLAAPRQP